MGRKNAVVLTLIVAAVAAALLFGWRASRPPPPAPWTPSPGMPAADTVSGVGSSSQAAAVLLDGVLVGRLVRGHAPKPIAGEVSVRSRVSRTRGISVGDDGFFRVDGLPRGAPLVLTARARGLATLRLPGIAIGPAGRFDTGDILLGAAQQLRVLVTDPLAAPVSGARVTLHPARIEDTGHGGGEDRHQLSDLAQILPAVETVSTGDLGEAGFTAVPPGDWLVRVSARGLASATRPARVREGRVPDPLKFRLGLTAALTGKVLDSAGEPVSGARLMASPYVASRVVSRGIAASLAVSDEAGVYSFTGLPREAVSLWWFPSPECERGIGSVQLPVAGGYDIRLPEVSTLAGVVVEESTGLPVSGARVFLSSWAWSLFGDGRPVSASTATDAEGGFTLEGLAPGQRGSLTVRKEGYLPFPAAGQRVPDLYRRTSTDPETPVRLALRRGVVVVGRVATADGSPVPGAQVWAVPIVSVRSGREGVTFGTRTPAVRTGANGSYLLEAVPPGRVLLLVDAVGYTQPGPHPWLRSASDSSHGMTLPERLMVAVPKDGLAACDIVLDRAAIVTGVVVDEDDRPLDGYRVGVCAKWENEGGRVHLGRSEPTDAEGRFAVSGVAPGIRRFALTSGPTGERGRSEAFDLAEGERVEGVRLVVTGIEEPASLAGFVKFADGSPATGVHVLLLYRTGYGESERPDVPRAVTGPDGAFRLEHVPAGKPLLHLRGPGVAPWVGQRVHLRPGEDRDDLALTVGRGCAIEGMVLDAEGRPVPGAAVAISRVEEGQEEPDLHEGWHFGGRIGVADRATATAGADGRFREDGLAEGDYWVEAAADGHLESWTRTRAGLSAVGVRLGRALTIAGRAVNAATGAPAAGVPVSIQYPRGDRVSSTDWGQRTATDGSFRFDGLGPGEFCLRFASHMNDPELDWKRSEVDDVPVGTLDLMVRLTRGLALAGRVIDEAGDPVAQATVELEYEGEAYFDAHDYGDLVTGEDGSFRFGGLDPGSYSIQIGRAWPSSRNPGDEGLVETVLSGLTAGDEAVVARVERGLTISGRVVGPDGRPARRHPTAGAPRVEICPTRPEGEAESGEWKMTTFCFLVREGQSFETPPLAPGWRYDLVASGFAEGAMGVLRGVEAGARDVVIRLREPLILEGRLVEQGGLRVPAGIRVDAEKIRGARGPGGRGSARSGEDGRFRIEGLVAGVFEIRLDLSRTAYMRLEEPLRAPAGSKDLVIELRPGAAISGRVLNAAGDPAPWSRVGVKGEFPRAGCGEDGTFFLGGLDPGDVTLVVRRRGGVEVEVGTFKAPLTGVVIRLPPE